MGEVEVVCARIVGGSGHWRESNWSGGMRRGRRRHGTSPGGTSSIRSNTREWGDTRVIRYINNGGGINIGGPISGGIGVPGGATIVVTPC